jgi:PAS domain S-box-containing protein
MNHFQTETFKILEILKNSPHGMSITEIARVIHKNKHSVGRYLEVLQVSGQIEMRIFGKAKVFSASSRIPLDLLMNHSREFTLILDDDNRIIHVNNFFLDLLKISREEMLGKNIFFVSSSSSPSRKILDAIQSCFIFGIPEKEICVETDTITAYLIRILAIVFNNGKKGTVVSIEDTTDKKNAEVLGQKYNIILDLTSNFIHEGMLISKKEHVVFANKSIENIFGIGCRGISLFYLIERIVPEDRDRIRKMFSEYHQPTEKSSEITFNIDSPSGKIKTVRGRFITFTESGEISCFLQLSEISDERLSLSTIYPENTSS